MPPISIDPEKPIRLRQQKNVLKETGEKYVGSRIARRRVLEDFCYRLNENEAYEKFSIIAVNSQCYPIPVFSQDFEFAQLIIPYPSFFRVSRRLPMFSAQDSFDYHFKNYATFLFSGQ